MDSTQLIAIAASVIALSVGYYLIKKGDVLKKPLKKKDGK
jgi:hypothetical protein